MFFICTLMCVRMHVIGTLSYEMYFPLPFYLTIQLFNDEIIEM